MPFPGNYRNYADRVKMRCLAVTRVLQVTEDHERHRVTPQIAPIDRAGAPPVPLGSAQICPAGAIRSGTGGRASQPGAAFIATINLSKVTRLSTRLML